MSTLSYSIFSKPYTKSQIHLFPLTICHYSLGSSSSLNIKSNGSAMSVLNSLPVCTWWRNRHEQDHGLPLSNPMGCRFVTGGAISLRIASNTLPNCASYFLSSAESFRFSSSLEVSILLRRTNARIISIFTRSARLLLRTLDNIATPCSVNAYGITRRRTAPT